ncbi:MAG: VOC family protein [Chloroflexota bacterium]|nr:MAG: hypothetical protein DLM70_16630 [Chloroflexota bacterium]
MVKIQGYSHIHLLVSDLQRSCTFYGAFGFVEQFRLRDEMVFLSTPEQDAWLTLHFSDSDQVGNSGGLLHVGLALDDSQDLEEAVRELEQNGGTVVERGEHDPGMFYAYVADPDGYVIEI